VSIFDRDDDDEDEDDEDKAKDRPAARGRPPAKRPRPRPARPAPSVPEPGPTHALEQAKKSRRLPGLSAPRERGRREDIADRFKAIVGKKPRDPGRVSTPFGEPSKYEDDDE